MRDLSIYLHIPFCVRKCLYCDFLSFPLSADPSGGDCPSGCALGKAGDCAGGAEETERSKGTQRMRSYVNLLKREITAEAGRYRDHRVISVFWGGGTPSLLPGAWTAQIMDTLRQSYRMAEDVEVTLEANPGTVTADRLREYITAGINRLSIGLQSTDDGELRRIGRIHDHSAFLETYRMAREAGFRNINIDLMAALPGQGVASYGKTLRRVMALRPEHISAYSLILEEGTPLYERREQYSFPTEEEDREMYYLTDTLLSAGGYHRYEISNYALAGYECRHNKVYWQRGDYAGFGLGAASLVENVRWSDPAEPTRYEAYVADLERDIRPVRQTLTRQEQMEEFMFLGLRMMRGVSRQAFLALFGQPVEEIYGTVLARLCRQKLLVCEGDCIRLTARGIDVSNYAMAEFLLP